ncbi:hypothetical protein CC78DRAFT_538040 [Lojkania enalia]|uniref:Uncharacterized protein n=1 Tax=Lojkania enalia TaxID=147567 RepID=A0A9P4JVY3_9PLEO|nr:hypothetical protein CC78DRAFT_538040 [Didymosphaeria enalia]
MPISRKEHKGRGAQNPHDACQYRCRCGSTSRNRYGRSDNYQSLPRWNPCNKPYTFSARREGSRLNGKFETRRKSRPSVETKAEHESPSLSKGECTPEIVKKGSVTYGTVYISTDDYTDDILDFRSREDSSSSSSDGYENDDPCRPRLSSRLFDPRVQSDKRRRGHLHDSIDVEGQFQMDLLWVQELLHHMKAFYDTVTVYSYELLKPGDIIYYLEAYVVPIYSAMRKTLVSNHSSAAVNLKGRFAIVVNVYGDSVKVANIYTFGDRGLAEAKSQWLWHEYAGIRSTENDFYQHPTNEGLEIGYSCCEMKEYSASVHLVTGKISLSNQIMIGGHITRESLSRLRGMIDKLENRGD